MPRNDFFSDDRWQRAKRDQVLVPQFYQQRVGGRFVLMDKGRLATFLQRKAAVDTVVQSKDGAAVGIEEKIVRWPGYQYTAYCLETESCTIPGRESPGWMRYAKADYLLYCFEAACGGLSCHLIDFPSLIEWFWPREETFPAFQMKQRNRTRGRKVPIFEVSRAVSVRRFFLPIAQEEAA